MKRKLSYVNLILLLLLLLLSGCNNHTSPSIEVIEGDIFAEVLPSTIPESSQLPTEIPVVTSSAEPTPTTKPTVSVEPTPTVSLSEVPTIAPSTAPSEAPTPVPTVAPTKAPSEIPTVAPSKAPTVAPKEDKWLITMYDDKSGSQGTFYTISNAAKDSLIVIDGGNKGNAEQVKKVIKDHGSHVNAWIITHYHPDHVDAFNEIFHAQSGIPGNGPITVDAVYAPKMDLAEYKEVAEDFDFPESFESFLALTEGNFSVSYVNRNDDINIAGIRMKFFNSYDGTSKFAGDIPNNCGLVFKVYGQSESMLFLSDVHALRMCEYLSNTYGDELKSTYLQPAHHGNNHFVTTFYDLVAPKKMFLDAPEWLVTGEQYKTQKTVKWCEDNNVEYCYFNTAPNTVELR